MNARWLIAALLPIGPAAVAVLRFVLPYETTDDAGVIVAKVASDPASESLVVWLGLLGTLTLVPAVLWVAKLARPAAPRVTAAALVLLVPAYLSVGFVVAGDAALLFGVREGLPGPVLARLVDGMHPALVVADLVFVVGHVAGTVLLGIALWLSDAVPRWVAVIITLSQPLHFVAAVVLGSHVLDLTAWGFNALGFAAAAVATLRTEKANGLLTHA